MPDHSREWLLDIENEIGSDLARFLRARMSNNHDAEDLAQEVYLRLLRAANTDQIRNHRAYVLRVAANVLYEWRLLARNRLSHSAGPLEEMHARHNTEYETDMSIQVEKLEAALQKLSPKCRAVLLLHRRDRHTYQEIAEKMGISVSMVKKYLVRGLSVCQAQLSKYALSGGGND